MSRRSISPRKRWGNPLPVYSFVEGLGGPDLFAFSDERPAPPPEPIKQTEIVVEDTGWEEWVLKHYPHYCPAPFGDRHRRIWNYTEALKPNHLPPALIEIWPRGSAKSTTVELNISRIQEKLSRRFVLYVCATQEKADEHVGNVAALLEERGVKRAVGQYGASKGWRKNQRRTENGFNIAGIGLDTAAARGTKLDSFRPDLIVFDDVDDEEDTQKTTAKKIRQITRKILPAGSTDCAVIFIQNLVKEDGIADQLATGKADFLKTRVVSPVEVAVRDLKVTTVVDPDTKNSVYKIVDGAPTWEGQSLAICEHQINLWGYDAFLREAQQKVKAASGYFFNEMAFRACERGDLPRFIAVWLAWDFGATQGGGDYTVWALMGMAANGVIYVIDLFHEQISSEKVEEEFIARALEFKAIYPRLKIRFPQDPGQAGKAQAIRMEKLLTTPSSRPENWKREPAIAASDVVCRTVEKKKAIRAKPLQVRVNGGNVVLVNDSWKDPEKRWNQDCREEHRKFREDETHDHDDIVDALGDGVAEMRPPVRSSGGAVGGGPSLAA
jgi:predicted phage terminase large subunit-like protein